MAEFVPVALKAGHVMRGGDDLEGRLYRELKRTQPAPQGICVVNAAGQVLNWVLGFDDHQSLLKFLDHTKARFAEYPDGSSRVAAQRHRNFPSHEMEKMADRGVRHKIPNVIGVEDVSSSVIVVPAGSLAGRVVGRALRKDGEPVSDTTKQENYVEDRFEISRRAQEEFLAAARETEGDKPVRVPVELARALVKNAYLGQLDLNPLGGREVDGVIEREEISFIAQRIAEVKAETEGSIRYAVVGRSAVSGRHSPQGNRSRDGRRWSHVVALEWQGYLVVNLEQSRIVQIELLAEGNEKLEWNPIGLTESKAEVLAHLPSGRVMSMAGRVRYGVVAER